MEILRNIVNFFISTGFSHLVSFIVGTGVGSIFFKELISNWFKEQDRVKNHKLQVAKHVHGICIEASTNNYKIKPRDSEHVFSVLVNIEGFSKDREIMMTKFVNLWGRIADSYASKSNSNEEIRNRAGMLKEIQAYQKELISWSNKIRYGKWF